MTEKFSFVEASARTSHNVEQAFNALALKIYEKMKSGEIVPSDEGSDGVKPGRGFGMKTGMGGSQYIENQSMNQSYKLTKENSKPTECKDECSC